MKFINYPTMLSGQFSMMQEALKRTFSQYDFDLRCAAPGIIQSFDEETQTVTVQLVIRDLIYIDTLQSVPIPLLADVPIIVPRAGDFVITIPPKKGDECLVVFADSCIDSWWKEGEDKIGDPNLRGTRDPMSRRRHDLSDGFAILGVWSQPNKVEKYATDGLEIRTVDGKNKIQLQDELIKIFVNEDTYIEVKDGQINVKTKDTLTVDATGDVTINGEKKINVNGSGDISVKSTNGKVDINSNGNMTIDSKGKMTVNSSGDMTVTGNGKVIVNSSEVKLGSGTAQKLLDARAIEIFNGHVHPTTSPGSPTLETTTLMIVGNHTTTNTEAS
jgi:uncharacterized protein (DUF2345 family)